MEITKEQLLKGKPIRIHNEEFLPTEAYVTPFFNRMEGVTDDFVIKVIEPSQITINKDGTEDVAYNRVSIEASIYDGTDYAETFGMVYALDTKKAQVKFFRCLKSAIHENLLMDRYDNILSQELLPGTTINFGVLDNLMSKEFDMSGFLNKLQTTDFDASNDNVNYKLGQWIRFAINFNISNDFGKVKIGTPDIIAGYKQIFEDSKSDFFISLGTHSNYVNIYNSFAKIIYDGKDIVNCIDKTCLMKDILSL